MSHLQIEQEVFWGDGKKTEVDYNEECERK
jgi:hypothetical protein